MNFADLQNTVEHLLKTSKCLHCKKSYKLDDINILATTKLEGLFDMRCRDCKCSTIVTVVLAPEKIEVKNQKIARDHNGISRNDVLDIKNFLNNFDGNFKKIFINEK